MFLAQTILAILPVCLTTQALVSSLSTSVAAQTILFDTEQLP